MTPDDRNYLAFVVFAVLVLNLVAALVFQKLIG
jgi:hypothetical protein